MKTNFLDMSNEEFDLFMVEKFPELYRQYHLDMSQTCMCWGFEIKPGWRSLVFDLSQKIDFFKRHGLVIEAKQVKEKFATLRFYLDCYKEEKSEISDSEAKIIDSIIWDLITVAENKSGKKCEVCGQSGKLVINNGWYFTLCEKHAKKDEIETK